MSKKMTPHSFGNATSLASDRFPCRREDYKFHRAMDHIDTRYQELNTEQAVLKTMLTEVKANMENEHEFIRLTIV